MQLIKQILKFASGISHSFSLHAILILILWICAIWYLIKIINDYKFDNFVTSVDLVKIDNEFPFLDDAQICIDFHNATVFSEVWSGKMSNEEIQARRATFDFSNLEKFLVTNSTYQNVSETPEKLSQSELIDTVILFEEIANLDKQFALCAFSADPTCSRLALFGHLEPIFNNDRLKMLKEEVWDNLKGNIVEGMGQNVDLSLVYLSTEKVCFLIPLSHILNIRNASATFALGMIMDKEEAINLSQPLVNIEFPHYTAPVIGPKSDTPSDFVIKIRNAGVYNKTQISYHCDGVNIIEADIDPFDSACQVEKYLKVLMDYCQCIPFSYSNLKEELPSHIRHCSINEYMKCLETIPHHWHPEDNCRYACVTWKNDYDFQIDQSADHGERCRKVDHEICASAFVTFRCQDLFYTLYEEKLKLTMPHLLAEIGGLLCFFTGFSILGLWQLMTCICSVYERRKRAEIDTHISVVPSWSTILVTYMEKGNLEIATHHDAKTTRERVMRDVERHIQGIHDDISSLSVSIGALESEIWKAKQLRNKSIDSSGRNTRRLQRKLWRNIGDASVLPK